MSSSSVSLHLEIKNLDVLVIFYLLKILIIIIIIISLSLSGLSERRLVERHPQEGAGYLPHSLCTKAVSFLLPSLAATFQVACSIPGLYLLTKILL